MVPTLINRGLHLAVKSYTRLRFTPDVVVERSRSIDLYIHVGFDLMSNCLKMFCISRLSVGLHFLRVCTYMLHG